MAAGSLGESLRSGLGLTRSDRLEAEAYFVGQCLTKRQPVLFVHRSSIALQASLWQRGDLVGQCKGSSERLASRNDAVGQTDALSLGGPDFATGQDHVGGM